ncbi:unnamed protein product [Blepharisma stoltei]|uniref:Uncharacterized protein n=1 Tax=Blepharisma stoltei TaxID=1481888 RepID=A0AAU9I6H4_9CILI|nr:unnamed protein product [Blepharisma stoltei]
MIILLNFVDLIIKMMYVKCATLAAEAIGVVAGISNLSTLCWESGTQKNFNKLQELEEPINSLIKRFKSEKSKIKNKKSMLKELRAKIEIIISQLKDHLDAQEFNDSTIVCPNTQKMRGNYSNPETISMSQLLNSSTDYAFRAVNLVKRGSSYSKKVRNGHYDTKNVTLRKGFKCGWSIGMALYDIYHSYDAISKAQKQEEESERLLNEAKKRKLELEEAVSTLKKDSDSLTDKLKELANNFYEIYENNSQRIIDLLTLENEFKTVKEELLEILDADEEIKISAPVYYKIYHIINLVTDMVKNSYQKRDQVLMERSITIIISFMEEVIDDSEKLIRKVYEEAKKSYSTLTLEGVKSIYLAYKGNKDLKKLIAFAIRASHNKSESDATLINRIYEVSRSDYPSITLNLIKETLEEIDQETRTGDAH